MGMDNYKCNLISEVFSINECNECLDDKIHSPNSISNSNSNVTTINIDLIDRVFSSSKTQQSYVVID